MVLYVSAGKKKKPEKTNWVMHQYHLGSDEEEREGELVVSKVFYQVQPRQIGPTGKDDVEEPGDVLEQVALEQVVEQSSCMPEPGHSHPKGLFVSLCEQVNNLEASLGEKQIEASISDSKIEKSVSTNENTSSVEISNTEVCLDDASQSELQEDHPLNLGSMPFSGSFDPELLKLLCSESLKGFSQGDGTSDWKSLIAEVCSKRESQDAFSLDKVSLGTPPDLLDQLFSSQGSFADWAEKLKLFSDSQKTEDFNLADFLQSSQPLP
ncbi:hypothetical protein KP509_23G048900 [Ceratopteris richardii]|nr:hypothetical protein KP509_23G048900 [Ceratopteris richardii]